MKTMRIAALALTLATLPVFALAQTKSTERIDQRQLNQQKRIDEGVKSGDLTKKEQERLQKGQQRVQKMEEKAMADGKMTNREKRRIENAQDQESRRIKSERNDRQKVKK